MSSAEEDQKRGGEFARLERQAERERARAEAQRVMDMCASRSAMQIFEAVGGDVSKRASANNPISLAAVRMAGSGDDAERRRSSAGADSSHNSILGRAANWVSASFFGSDGRMKKKEDDEFNRNIAPRRHSELESELGGVDPSTFEGVGESPFSTWCGTLTSQCRQNRKMLLVLAAAAAIVTIGVVGLAVGGGDGATGFLGIYLPQKDRLEAMKAILVKSGVSSATSLDDLNSPQAKALKWIAHNDPAAISVKNQFMPQRYGLACLWFASMSDDESQQSGEDKPEWVKADNWLSGKGLCAWVGVTCHHNPKGSLSETHYDANNGVTAISLPSNGLRGALPKEVFTALPDLISLDLKGNDITALPEEMGSATKLEFLRLENCAIQNLPNSIGLMKSLHLINLYHNSINGTIPESISDLSNLKELYLDSNYLSGSIEGIFDNMSELVDLRLRRNALSGQVPSFQGLENLEILYLDACKFSGTLSASFGTGMPKLRDLSLYKNILSGELPASMSTMTRPERVYIDHNRFTGSIPPSFSNLKALKHFFVYKNALNSSLDVLAEMDSMVKLRLEENQFSGTISSSFGSLKDLEVLVLSNNDISGELPSELGQLSKLNRLMAPNTNVDGIVPEEVCSLTKDYALTEFVMTCRGRGMEGGVLCSCCTECKSDLDV